jgi:hypothetical protein
MIHQYFQFFSSDNLAYLVTAFGLAVFILLIVVIRLEFKLRRMLIGKNAVSLEDSVVNLTASVKDLQHFTKEMEKYLLTVEKRLKQSVQGLETIRFNPFKGAGTGGINSFSTAFINERGDGLVLTGLYTRDKVSLFAKPIKNFKSEFELAEEEQAALAEAKKNAGV